MKDNVAIVVTYNRKNLLKENIEALLNQTYKNFDIIIVDNASTDRTYEEIVQKYEGEQLKYINTGKNIGGAGGFNYGIREAIKRNYKNAWIMDDDTIPEKEALESLIKKAGLVNNKFSFISSLCKWINGEIANMNKQVITKKFLDDYKSFDNRMLVIERASFVSLFINLSIVKKVGLPYKEFFIYGDDWEYCLRLGKEEKGYLDFDSIVVHKMKTNNTANIFTIEKEKIDRCFYNYRNLLFTYRKISKKLTIKYLISSICNLIEIPFKAKNYKLKRIKTVIKGVIAGLFFNPKIEYID